MANRRGLRWMEPFITCENDICENNNSSEAELSSDAVRYRERLVSFANLLIVEMASHPSRPTLNDTC